MPGDGPRIFKKWMWIPIVMLDLALAAALIIFLVSKKNISANKAPEAGENKPAVETKGGQEPVLKCMPDLCARGQCLAPGGEFIAGCTYPECEDSTPVVDLPPHYALLQPFCMDRTEVSNAEFEKWKPWHRSRRNIHSPGDNDPVLRISYYEAEQFCEWKGGRLPTETQWEMAAKGGKGSRFPWGPNPLVGPESPTGLSRLEGGPTAPPANVFGDGDGYSDLAPVDAFPQGQSGYGILNLAGNAMEWTRDCGNNDAGECRPVLKGGSWLNELKEARTTYRLPVSASIRSVLVGFRCVSEPILNK